MAYGSGKKMTKINAPSFTTSEVSLAMLDSSLSVMFGLMYSRQMLRVNRLAAAIDMMEAGTSAPIAMAPKAKPANHEGNIWRNRPGTTNCAPYGACGWMLAARPIRPNSAINPSKKLYAGSSAALRLMACRLLELSTPVMECGYMNSARAEPSASEPYEKYAPGASSTPVATFLAFKAASAAAKMLPKPPSLIGMMMTAAMMVM